MSYTEVTISSYNATPPTDDGATGTANEITWAGIKTKLGDPLNTAIAAINTNVTTPCGVIDAAVIAANVTISGLSTSLSAAQTALYAPVGTAMLFMQTNAPTLWTKSATHNNKALRLVTGTASSGGSTGFTSVLASRTLTTAEMPAHSHTIAKSGTLSFNQANFMYNVSKDEQDGLTSGGTSSDRDIDTVSASFSATISFDGTTDSKGSGSAMDFAVQYVDVIIATKN